jgi:hypothetical protein
MEKGAVAFAGGVLFAITAIAIAAIARYTVEDALKVWTGLNGLIGVITGAAATYFFTRPAATKAQAFTAAMADLDPGVVTNLRQAHPVIDRALR